MSDESRPTSRQIELDFIRQFSRSRNVIRPSFAAGALLSPKKLPLETLSNFIELGLRIANDIHVFVFADIESRRESVRAFVRTHGAASRVKTEMLKSMADIEEYATSTPELDLVIVERAYFDWFDRWNDVRDSNGQPRFSVLSVDVEAMAHLESRPRPPFHHASLGGTFNKFHDGHRAYIELGLRLADDLHVFVSDDSYASTRKDYEPRKLESRRESVRAFVRTHGAASRVKTEMLKSMADIEEYATSTPELDLVIVERAYFDWFDRWNDVRDSNGQPRYCILCKSRTKVGTVEIASSMWSIPSEPAYQRGEMFPYD